MYACIQPFDRKHVCMYQRISHHYFSFKNERIENVQAHLLYFCSPQRHCFCLPSQDRHQSSDSMLPWPTHVCLSLSPIIESYSFSTSPKSYCLLYLKPTELYVLTQGRSPNTAILTYTPLCVVYSSFMSPITTTA